MRLLGVIVEIFFIIVCSFMLFGGSPATFDGLFVGIIGLSSYYLGREVSDMIHRRWKWND